MISQPMGGLTKEEILNIRKEAMEYLESQGYEVLDTYYENLGTDDESSINRGLWYLGRSLMDMAKVDAVYFCDGWNTRPGCKIEYEAAREYGLYIIIGKEHSKKTPLTFGDALILLRSGVKMTRKGWNGKGLFVVYQKGYPEGIPCNRQTAEAWGIKEGDLFRCDPYLQINTTDHSHAMWQPSIRDCLAEDWVIFDEETATSKVAYSLEFENDSESNHLQDLTEKMEKTVIDLFADHVVDSDKTIKSVSIELELEVDE